MTDTAAGDQALELLRRIVDEDPITYNVETGDYCWFCEGPEDSNILVAGREGGYTRWADHAHDCPWVAGRRLFGLELGRHTVTAHIIDAEATARRLELGQ